MTGEKWRIAWEIYRSAQELPENERLAFLNSAGTDPEILREVLVLLDQPDDQPQHPLERRTSLIEIGSRVGRYVVLAAIGRGGMGTVYSARDEELGRIVALKFLAPELVGEHSAERLMREAKMLSTLNHPNIVTVYEVIQSGPALAIAMELVEGTPLRTLCGTALEPNRVIYLGHQIAEALAAAHSRGITHRDVKPENIMLREDGYVKVLDFGLARQIALTNSASSVYGLPAGTLRYMSPEQVRGEAASSASDVFSLGLVLYELAAGKHPFAADSAFETAYATATKEPASLPKASWRAPADLERLILAMLEKTPGLRPSAREVAERLQTFTSARPEAVTRPTIPKVRTPLLWVAALAGLSAAAVLGWFALHRTKAPEFTNLKIEPLTSQLGWEESPAVSPDGQAVAFTWAEKLDQPHQIYLKKLNEDQPVKLAAGDEGIPGFLAWSPDGKRIACKFKLRDGESGAIYSMSSSGGDEKKLVDLMEASLSSEIDWSADGTELAFSDRLPDANRLAIFVLNLSTGEKRKLTSPPAEYWGDWDPKFSPDGRTVAFKRVAGFWVDDVYLIARNGGSPRRLTSEQRGIWGHAWTADGESLIVSCQRSGTLFGLWRFPLAGRSPPERITQGGIDAITPTSGRRTTRLAWVNRLEDLNIYRAPFRGVGGPTKLVASTLRDQGASYSPDGRIAFVSDRSGSREIWIAKGDGSSQTRVTSFPGRP